jgi:hypothetical protein
MARLHRIVDDQCDGGAKVGHDEVLATVTVEIEPRQAPA